MPTLYPPTGHFPADPCALERSELEESYRHLRHSYRGLKVSRGLFRGEAERSRVAMHQLESKLRAIAEREASIRQEAYQMLEIVTEVIGELEDAGDTVVNEFGAYQRGRRSMQGAGFIGRLISSIATFIRHWTATKQKLNVIVEKQQAMQAQLQEGSDGQDR